ncbi:calcium-binding protein [Caldimonas brevitalea]|uniref:Alkaline phosphatase n=1 Tax=Caldimonas brevitalea TaxID=413882 RepID=A0A0G3BL40_9BURK|nr:calcium-binding protein [Caldimonas brevitalea]AKJ28086.1 alkaline phosphatase [Caldimonas brevitalea]
MTIINGTSASEALNDTSADPLSTLNANWSLGEDTMTGGAADDTYHVNSFGDRAIEGSDGGQDTVVSRSTSHTLARNIENLTLDNTPTLQVRLPDGGYDMRASAVNGAGNELDNVIKGNDRNNNLSGRDGNDKLFGRFGDDVLNGGNGSDMLDGGEGNDVLLGGSGNDFLHGDWGDDSLQGGAGDDLLDGAGGVDTMVGGTGNDRYVVERAGDKVVESLATGGHDHVLASFTYTLTANVEDLTLHEVAGGINGHGNAGGNTLVGNAGDNQLFGHGGNDVLDGGFGRDLLDGGTGNDHLKGGPGGDTLTGGTGADRFEFRAAGDNQAATITDFSHADDTIVLNQLLDWGLAGAVDGGLQGLKFVDGNAAGHALSAPWFFKGSGYTGGQADNFCGIYVNTTDGQIWYNPTTADGGDSLLIGRVSTDAARGLDSTDFVFGT